MKYKLSHLNKEQLDAASDLNNPVRIIAGPGSGKTRTMVAKYLHLIINKEVDISKILFLTFTNKATDEILSRVINALDKLEYNYDQSELKISTIHGLCKRIIDEYHDIFNSEVHATNILTEISQASFILTFIEDYGFYSKAGACREITSSIIPFFNKVTDENLDVETLYTYLTRKMNEVIKSENIENPASEMVKFKTLILYTSLLEIYKEKMIEKKYIDFSHLQQFVFKEIESNNRLRKILQDEIYYVLVDEYQDTSSIQSDLLIRLLKDYTLVSVLFSSFASP